MEHLYGIRVKGDLHKNALCLAAAFVSFDPFSFCWSSWRSLSTPSGEMALHTEWLANNVRMSFLSLKLKIKENNSQSNPR
jgi:hypothetical protein